jgi:N-acetylglucosamine-6-sulfatase
MVNIIRRALPRRLVTAAALSLCLVVTPVVSSPAAALDTATVSTDRRPNIVVITTDDQRADDMRYLKRTRNLLGRPGVTYADFLSPHPLCCPARAQLLTGQYAQNNGVRHNKGPHGGYRAFRESEQHHVGAWLQAAGYRTGFVGKFLNMFPKAGAMVPGWDVFDPSLAGAYSPFGITMFNNGDPQRFEDTYTVDLVSRRTIATIEQFAAQDEPFFVYSSQIAPHGMHVKGKWIPPVPAPRHADMFGEVEAPSLRDPSFNEKDLSDKYAAYRSNPAKVAKVNRLHRQRIRSLQSVDEAVRDTVRALHQVGELDNTLILFTSDNGYLLGEHRWQGKQVPYEPALQIPLLIRGPGIPEGQVRTETRTLVDIVPTIVEAARARATVRMDGRPLTDTLHREDARGYGTVLIQAGHESLPWEYRGVRTRRHTYVEYHDGFTELYDRRRDPHQMRNLTGDSGLNRRQRLTRTARTRPLVAELKRRLDALADCSGAAECGSSLR